MDQELDIPIVGGVDTGIETTAGVKPLSMVNCWYRKDEGVSKRYGILKVTTADEQFNVFNPRTDSYTGTSGYDASLDPGNGSYVAWAGDNPLSLFSTNNGIRLRSSVYTRKLVSDHWVITDMLPATVMTQITLGGSSTSKTDIDSVDFTSNAQYGCIIWSESLDIETSIQYLKIYYSIVDLTNMTVVVDRREVPLPSGASATDNYVVQCANAGTGFMVWYRQKTATDLYGYLVNGTDFDIASSPTVTLTDIHAYVYQNYGASFVAVNDRASNTSTNHVVYIDTSGNRRIRTYNSSGTQTSTSSVAAGIYTNGLYGDMLSGYFYLVQVSRDFLNPGYNIYKIGTTGTVITSSTSAFIPSAATVSAYSDGVYLSYQSLNGGTNIVVYDITTLFNLYTKNLSNSGLCGSLAKMQNLQGDSFFLQMVSPIPPTLWTTPYSIDPATISGSCLTWVAKVPNSLRDIRVCGFSGFGSKGSPPSTSGTFPKSMNPTVYTAGFISVMDGNVILQKVEVETSGRGSFAQTHDMSGDSISTINSVGAPYVSIGGVIAAGPLDGNTSYSVTAVLTGTDGEGRVVESVPAIPATVNLSASMHAIDISVFLPAIALNLQDQKIKVYRTQGNQQAYLLDRVIPVSLTSVMLPDYVLNYINTTSDNDIADNEQLYTEGGALDHSCPASFTCTTIHQNRLFLGGTPDDTIWYSNERIAGETYNFNEGLTFQPFEGGRVVALQSLDSALVVFKSNDIFAIQGQGPDDTGANSSYGNPTSIQSNTGCVEADSVVGTPLGVFFRGRRGLYLLDRALQVKYVGKPIEDLLASTNSITCAVYVEKTNQVRFFTSLGTVFVYDLLHEAWSTFTYSGLTFVKACMHEGSLYMLTDTKVLYRETPDFYLDDGSFIPMSFQTSFFRPQGGLKQAWQRFRRISVKGRKDSPVNVSVTLYRDFTNAYSESRSWTAQEIDATYRPSDPQVQVHPTVQKLQGLSIGFSETTPTGGPSVESGQGWTLQAISCKVAAARGEAKLPSGNNK